MENVNLSLAAKVMKVDEKILQSFPEEIQDTIISILEFSNPKTDEKYYAMCDKLHEQWERGSAYLDMVDIAERTNIELNTLLELDVKTQLGLAVDFAMDLQENKSDEEIYNHLIQNISTGQTISQLPIIAKLLGVSFRELRSKYDRDVWEQLCGAYLMLSDEELSNNRKNTELMDELRDILKEADKNKEEK